MQPAVLQPRLLQIRDTLGLLGIVLQALSDDGQDDDDEAASASSDLERVLNEQELDHLDTEELLKLLSPEQIADFQMKLQATGTHVGLFDQTVTSQYSLPWWQFLASEEPVTTEHTAPDDSSDEVLTNHDVTPNTLPRSLLPPLPASPNLGLTFQIVTVIFGYVYTIRRFGLRTLQETSNSLSLEDQSDILLRTTEVIPLLFQSSDNSSHPLASISDCQTFFFNKLDLDSSEVGEVGDLLLSDLSGLASTILCRSRRSNKIIELSSEASGSETNHLVCALSDLHALLDHFITISTNTSSEPIISAIHTVGRKSLKKAILKLRFYIAFVWAEPLGIDEVWKQIEREITTCSKGKSLSDSLVEESSRPSLLCFHQLSNQSIVDHHVTSNSARIVEMK